MRNEELFVNEVNHARAALSAELRCDCGNKTFHIAHSGKLRKGLLGGVSIWTKDRQLSIKCSCVNCAKSYHLYDSTRDGTAPTDTPLGECVPLTIKGQDCFQIKLRYNFREENYKTDRFDMFFLDIKVPESQKHVTVCEL